MKVALCLHGLVGSTKSVSYDRDESDLDGKKLCAELAFKDWKKYIIDENDVDVFIHSWDLDLKNYLVESYQPKKYQIEKQIIFKPEYKEDNPRNRAVYSRFYGSKKVIELKQKYEKDNNFKYDCDECYETFTFGETIQADPNDEWIRCCSNCIELRS